MIDWSKNKRNLGCKNWKLRLVFQVYNLHRALNNKANRNL